MNDKQVSELLLQSLEHEIGSVLVYEAALKCAVNENLRQEWERYLDETRNHVRILTDVCIAVGLDPDRSTPGRRIVQELGWALIATMEKASVEGPSETAQLVACECAVMAETKDHLDWELIGKCADKFRGERSVVMKDAANEIEVQRDEHLYQSREWCRELWMDLLGMRATLPPLDERRFVKAVNGSVPARHVQRS